MEALFTKLAQGGNLSTEDLHTMIVDAEVKASEAVVESDTSSSDDAMEEQEASSQIVVVAEVASASALARQESMAAADADLDGLLAGFRMLCTLKTPSGERHCETEQEIEPAAVIELEESEMTTGGTKRSMSRPGTRGSCDESAPKQLATGENDPYNVNV